MSPRPQVHRRKVLMDQASKDLTQMLDTWHYRWDLTFAEQVDLLTEAINKRSRTHIRMEREVASDDEAVDGEVRKNLNPRFKGEF